MRGMSFGRAALKYYPEHKYSTALRRFREELKNTPELYDELKSLGYTDSSRYLNAMQMSIIIKRLGDY